MEVKVLRRLLIALPAAGVIIVLSVMPLMAEYVFINDGSIIEGTIESDSATAVMIRTTDKKQKQILRKNIMRILYTELRMSKIYIQKRDGEGLVAFMVDEDRVSYTFRKDLYKPEEFVLNRTDVLFISEKNPSGLKVTGEIGTNSVSLAWLPPYDAVKQYNVYITKNKSGKYEVIGSSKDKSITLKNLSSNTTYYLIVTSVDMENYESTPSNELKITTRAAVEVELKDGRKFKTYLISEGKDEYIFRDDLFKPEIFTVKRSDILFITERYPSGLKGTPGTNSIDLNWLAPYDPVSNYNIYIKTKGNEYKIVSTSSDNSETLKGLASNTEYTIKTTGVDKDKTESSPSNEIKIITKNIPPDKTVIISSGNIGADERKIVWNPSSDIDGKVEKYRLYGTKGGKREMVAETKTTEYDLKNARQYKKFEIAAVDEMGDESNSSWVKLFFSTAVGFNPGIIIPTGKFAKLFNPGIGGIFTISERNLLFYNFEAGAALGFYYLPGKDLLEEKNKDYKYMMLVPLYLTAAYNIEIGDSFIIKPVLSIGGVYIDMDYIDRNKTIAEGQARELQIVEPAYKAGLAVEYKYTDKLSFSAGCDYGAIRQNTGLMTYISINAGIGYSF